MGNSKVKIIDNFLPDDLFDSIFNVIKDQHTRWNVSSEYDMHYVQDMVDDDFSHILREHNVYDSEQKYSYQNVLSIRNKDGFTRLIHEMPIMVDLTDYLETNLDVIFSMRMKINMTFCGETQKSFGWHLDDAKLKDIPHKVAILYFNDNNGFTLLEDGTKIESKGNRLVLIGGDMYHTPVNQTDVDRRFVLNYNFI